LVIGWKKWGMGEEGVVTGEAPMGCAHGGGTLYVGLLQVSLAYTQE